MLARGLRRRDAAARPRSRSAGRRPLPRARSRSSSSSDRARGRPRELRRSTPAASSTPTRTGTPPLAGLDLHVDHGERVALLGPNGAGKTTFVLHLNGLLTGQGELEVAGLDVVKENLRELRARVGLVFQDPDDQLFMPTVREDVAFGPLNMGLDRDEVDATRRRGARRRPHGTRAIDRAPHQLSMGERRRVAIATVLAMRPHLLVLDEPSANLDPRARRELLDVLERIDRTMLVVTHDLPFAAELCERAVILSRGRDRRRRAVRGGPRATRPSSRAHDLELPAGFDPARVDSRPTSVRRHPCSVAARIASYDRIRSRRLFGGGSTRRARSRPSAYGHEHSTRRRRAFARPLASTSTSTLSTSTSTRIRRRDALARSLTHEHGLEDDHGRHDALRRPRLTARRAYNRPLATRARRRRPHAERRRRAPRRASSSASSLSAGRSG